jgi:hypothetical protein
VKIIGYIFAGLLTLVFLLLLSTVGADISYSNGNSMLVLMLNGIRVYKVPLFPDIVPPALAKKKPEELKEKPPTEQALIGMFTGIGDVLSFSKRALSIFYRRLIKKIVVSELKIHIGVATDDAVRTTVLFGNLSALVNTVCATLSYMVTLQRCDVNIVPDYASNETRANMRAVFRLRILRLLFVAAALYPMYKELKERKKKNEQPSD